MFNILKYSCVVIFNYTKKILIQKLHIVFYIELYHTLIGTEIRFGRKRFRRIYPWRIAVNGNEVESGKWFIRCIWSYFGAENNFLSIIKL